ncbi:MAG: asparagine--tRNA ligase [Candidatus Eremiobacterota bacterium]
MATETSTVPVATIETVGQFAGQKVCLQGWLDNMRSSGKIAFLKLRDGTGRIQGVMSKADVGEDMFALARGLNQEASIRVHGMVREDSRAPGGYELHLDHLEVVQNNEGYPITPKDHGTDFLMDNRHLWIRSNRQHAVLRVRAQVMRSIMEWLDDHGFLRVDTPILTPSACEGTTTLFETEYFDNKAYLSQSGQLYNEANAMAFGKVYCFGPTFRAEKSKTRRHLMEFWMVEPEMAWCDMWQNMEVQEQLVSHVVQECLRKRRRELEVLERDFTKLEAIVPPFPRLHYDEAVELLRQNGVDFAWGGDFGGGDETILSEKFDKPVFVHHFPAAVKAFYMKPDPDRPDTVLGADLLAPEGYGEIIGGGQRLEDLALLEQRIAEHKLPAEAYAWYVDLRRYGSVPHAGFGLGVERTVTWICGIEHVRETIAFPRLLSRLYP